MRRLLVAVALVLLASAQTPRSYVGLQVLTVVGVHRDADVNQYGIGAGPLIQARLGGRRVAASIEGIPVVGIPSRASAAYGQATPSLGIFNGQLLAAVDRDAHLWLGLGTTIYNQRTPSPAQHYVVSSRLAGVRYALAYRRPTRNRHFVEAFVGAAPVLSGTDHYLYSDGTPSLDRAERASEIDASVSLGWRQRSTEWLIGVRMVNFSAHFVPTGDAADRNVGIGPLVEWRHVLP